MGLLESLGLPKAAAARPASASGSAPALPVQTTVTIVNQGSGPLVLAKAALAASTASFSPSAPATVAARGEATFRVIEPVAGAKKTAGMALYRYTSGGRTAKVTFVWSGKTGSVKTAGDGTWTGQVHAVEDLDSGNEYRLTFGDGNSAAAAPASSAAVPPVAPAAAAAPTTVTVVNATGYPLLRGSSVLDGPATQKSAPPERVDAGRRGRFEILDGDPAAPYYRRGSIGSVAYSFTPDNADDPNRPGTQQIAYLEWQGDAWGVRIEPGMEGYSATPGGSTGTYVFTVTGPEVAFEPPPEASEPTLRVGDKSADGWVEYVQSALNFHMSTTLEIDGIFGAQTLKAVKAFQRKFKKEGVLEDGVVGDQTWSYLRDGAPAKPKTDGRKPHSFVEHGVEARWTSERDLLVYDYGSDAMLLMATSVGDVLLVENRRVRIRIVDPQGRQKVVDRPIGPPFAKSANGQSQEHLISVQQFSTLFDEDAAGGSAAPGVYAVTAYFPADLGGDTFDGKLDIMG